MARRRFFVEDVRLERAEIAGEDARHLTQVLRVEPGQQFEISDNQRVWLAEVESCRKERVVFRTLTPVALRPPGPSIALYLAILKFDHFELAIEKATELGVEIIVPVRAARSEHGLERAIPKRMSRWRRIALESSQQSRRDRLPEIRDPVPFSAALTDDATVRLFLDEEGGEPILNACEGPSAHTALLVGPEGGWTGEERKLAVQSSWIQVGIGRQILRAETAAVAALAVIQAAHDRREPGYGSREQLPGNTA